MNLEELKDLTSANSFNFYFGRKSISYSTHLLSLETEKKKNIIFVLADRIKKYIYAEDIDNASEDI